ncbi:MAG: LPS export ABC transporter periplasmic protein LptC [Cyanobacteria bacterium]|nr:LPS export ABC transporter periplasmic protein LptC [Cyanobacteriota bacterium]
MKRWYGLGLGGFVLFVALVMGLRAIRQDPAPNYVADEEQQDALTSGLTLRDVTLEQPDENGQLLWRVHAETVTYSPDQQTPDVTRPQGELYLDGKMIYRVTARRGQILEDGQLVILTGNIVATGIESQAVLRGNELQWRVQDDLMVLRDRITGTHPQLRLAADEARVYEREQRMELEGEVIANTVVEDPSTEPWLKLQADILEWRWQDEEVESQASLRVERFLDETITEVISGETGLLELQGNRATLTNNVVVELLALSLRITGDHALWDVDAEQIVMDRPLRADSEAQAVTLTAQQGQFDLADQIVNLTREVVVVGNRHDGRLTADRLRWNLATQTVVAEGAVNYRQGDPSARIRGPQAVGYIQEQRVVISGGQVVTEIAAP